MWFKFVIFRKATVTTSMGERKAWIWVTVRYLGNMKREKHSHSAETLQEDAAQMCSSPNRLITCLFSFLSFWLPK